MRIFIFIMVTLSFVGCQTDTEMFDDVIKLAEIDVVYKPTLIQSGREGGILEPVMEYSLFRIDSLAFQNLKNSIEKNERFKEGSYYLNIELDDYLNQNNFEILNISYSSITENQFDKTYYVYLLSDGRTFVVCKVNE